MARDTTCEPKAAAAVIWVSVLAALLGVLAAGVGVTRLRRVERSPEVYWFLGLAALLPAWLIAFVGLLGSTAGRVAGPGVWTLSSAAGLIGVILTDRAVQRQAESGRQPPAAWYWRLGMLALLPAWVVALAGLALIR